MEVALGFIDQVSSKYDNKFYKLKKFFIMLFPK